MSKILKKHKKTLFFFLLGIVIASTTVYGATILYQSNQIGYDNTNSGFKDSSGNNITDVDTALEELYTLANSSSECKYGYVKTNETTDEYTCVSKYTMAAMCPGCVFAKYTSDHYIQGKGTPNTLSDVTTTTDYTTLNSNYFLGHVLENGYIKRSFACGIENGQAFCLEGYDTSKYSNNVDILNHFFSGCNASSSGSYGSCYGSSLYYAYANPNGSVNIDSTSSSKCSVYGNSRGFCS